MVDGMALDYVALELHPVSSAHVPPSSYHVSLRHSQRSTAEPCLASAATLSGTKINTDYQGNLYRLHQSLFQRFSAEIEDVRLFLVHMVSAHTLPYLLMY